MIRGMKSLVDREAQHELYREYRRRIDCQAVLDHYGAQNGYMMGDEYQHSCLIDRVDPHHAHGDQNPSARMNIKEKLYVCWSYGGMDIFHFIMKMEGKETFLEIVPMLGQFLSGAVENEEDFLAELETYFASDNREVVQPVIYHKAVLRNWASVHPYVKSRGVSQEAASRLQIGYDPVDVRITFPVWRDGLLVGWQKRALTDPRWPQTPLDKNGRVPKMVSSSGFPRSTTLYNQDLVNRRRKDSIIVVESPFSVAKAETFMTDDDDTLAGVVATFGSKVSKAQIEMLAAYSKVTVYMDDDDAGRKGAKVLLEGLHRRTNVFHVEPEVGKDLADYETRDEVMKVIGRAEPAILAMIGL